MAERTSNTLPPGYQLDEYVIERVLGIGGFGVTYKAEDNLHRAVAIKEYMPVGIATRSTDAVTVRPASSNHAEEYEWGLDRFRMEAQTLVAFRHPNIVTVFRYFSTNGTAYLVMEFQEGQTLADLLASDKTLNEREIHAFLDPLLDGLEEVHRADFAHRDIKPGNIFISRDGSPVLIDFGAARQAMGSHSRALTSIVTAGYAPYEQYETDTVQGPWTDIYALGATLYRAVTGERPVEAPRRAGAVMRGEDDPNPPASRVAAGKYSAPLLHAIDKALEVLEQNRPQSVAAFRALMRGDVELERPTEMRPGTPPVEVIGDTRPPAAPRRGGNSAGFWIGLVLALVVAGGATAGGIWYYVDQQEQAEIEARRKAEREKQERLEAERKEQERLEAERKEQEGLEAERKKQERLEAERKERERLEAERKKIGVPERDPNGTNTDRNNSTTSRDGTWRAKSNVLAPVNHKAILGEWCSDDYKIRLTPTNFHSSNRRTTASGTYKLVRYEFYKSHVRFHYQPASGGPTYGVYEFQAVPGDPNKLRLTRTFYGGKWTSRSSVYSRNCS